MIHARAGALRSACLAMTLAAGCGGTAARGPAPAESTACEIAAGNASPLRTADSVQLYVEAPEIAEVGDRIYLIGSPSVGITATGEGYHYDGTRVLLAGAVLDRASRVTLLHMPRGSDRMHTPRVAVVRDGLEMLWLPGNLDGSRREDAAVLSSRLGPQGWSEPAVVHDIPTAAWDETRVSNVAMGAGHPWLIASARRVVREADGWRAAPLARGDVYATLADARDDVRLMAFVAYGDPDGNTLYAQRSTDGGMTWLPRVRVSAPGSGAVYETQLLAPRGTRREHTLVWAAGGTSNQEFVRLAMSPDTGRTWRDAGQLQVPAGFATMRVAASEDGAIHLVVQEVTGPATRPRYLRWLNGTWSSRTLAADATVSFGVATIASLRDGTTLIAWGEQQGTRLVTRIATIPGCRVR